MIFFFFVYLLFRNRFNFDNAAFNSRRFCMPQIKAKTNLDALKVTKCLLLYKSTRRFSKKVIFYLFQKNYIYQSIKYGSGFNTDDTSPVAKWSLVQMLQNRQVNSFFLLSFSRPHFLCISFNSW